LRAWKREQQQAKEVGLNFSLTCYKLWLHSRRSFLSQAIAKEQETKDKEGRARAEATKNKLDGFLVGLLGGPKK
jgi:hypothetical protein